MQCRASESTERRGSGARGAKFGAAAVELRREWPATTPGGERGDRTIGEARGIEQHRAAERRMAELRVRRRDEWAVGDFAQGERRGEPASVFAEHSGDTESVQRGVSGRAE